jgi:hypothetical protein
MIRSKRTEQEAAVVLGSAQYPLLRHWVSKMQSMDIFGGLSIFGIQRNTREDDRFQCRPVPVWVLSNGKRRAGFPRMIWHLANVIK